MNYAKCTFSVSVGNVLGFLVHHRGIKVDKNKACVIIGAPLPITKKKLQSLLGKINILCQFISNLAGKMKAFSTLLSWKIQTDLNGVKNTRMSLPKLRSLSLVLQSSYLLSVENLSSCISRLPKNPLVVFWHNLVIPAKNMPFFTSAETSTSVNLFGRWKTLPCLILCCVQTQTLYASFHHPSHCPD